MTIAGILLLARQLPVARSVFMTGTFLNHFLGVLGGKGWEEDATLDWPWRDGFLFHPHDDFFVTKREYSL